MSQQPIDNDFIFHVKDILFPRADLGPLNHNLSEIPHTVSDVDFLP